MSDTKPTLVLVPGAWYHIDTYHKLVAVLEAQGFRCVPVALPSSTTHDPATTFLDDLQVVRRAIVAETDQGRDVVVVVHSYGGLPGHSASKGLTLPHRGSDSTTDTHGHVLGFVGLATGFTVTGKTLLDGMGGAPPPLWRIDEETGFAVVQGDARNAFYHDLPEAEGAQWVARLGCQTLRSLREGGEHTYSAWLDVPSWYVVATEDRAAPAFVQRMFVQQAVDAGGEVTVRELPTSHSPMLSMPVETAQIIAEAVAEFVARKG
ncbi:Alpha/beta hydrolase fold-1 [Lasiosphaeria miniovina]|uniref:Alpha/beta hydrolase fold-1 n=1 Tax=Lasiosphaeria miniovina TaxID=1954250 RepID=A0AA40DS62_9PEZI|nr:Alpha/beta hydrolase fold-1 [Lasiosphaeria miniovina]KAK0709998.1 Alpha/beta hydrolase fold-1 [Lasiosphaeria miniovina]